MFLMIHMACGLHIPKNYFFHFFNNEKKPQMIHKLKMILLLHKCVIFGSKN